MRRGPTVPNHSLEARYANYFTVGHNEFEFLFDFGQVHVEPVGARVEGTNVQIVRIVMGPPFAKALLETLRRSIDDYELAHGEIDAGEPR